MTQLEQWKHYAESLESEVIHLRNVNDALARACEKLGVLAETHPEMQTMGEKQI